MTDLPPPFDLAWFRFFLGFIVGATLGSFGTMLVYRLPRGLSIVKPRSHCPTCGRTLGVLDLVPIFSWLVMRGRCRHCHTRIGARYIITELTISFLCGIIAAKL